MERREVFGRSLYSEMQKCSIVYGQWLEQQERKFYLIQKLMKSKRILNFYMFTDAARDKYRRICHYAEDPIERSYAEDKHLERNFAHIRKHEDRENAKLKVRLIKRNPEFRRKIEEMNCSKKRSLRETIIVCKRIKFRNL